MLRLCCDLCGLPVGWDFIYEEEFGVFCSELCWEDFWYGDDYDFYY